MNSENVKELSDDALVEKLKKIKTGKILDAALIGLALGIVFYSAVKNGFGFFTFLPLILVYFIYRKSSANKILEKDIQQEMEIRNKR